MIHNFQIHRFPLVILALCTFHWSTSSAQAQLDFESAPIDYIEAPADNPISRLQDQIDRGEVELKYDESHGYLPALLEALGVSRESQMLVFSQTSFQLRKISPLRPRAIYFNDETYLGWVQNGDVVEISTVDPKLGAVFYTLKQQPVENVAFVRDRGQCLTCHASSRTQGVPGHLVRSVYPNKIGQPLLASGTYTTDHTSPFAERWGGWYVTGKHGAMRHLGNAIVEDEDDYESLDREQGANKQDLSCYFATTPYLTPHSDLVSLMVLEHQTQMHNAITLASMETRIAEHYDDLMNEALDRDPDHRSDSTHRRIDRVCQKLCERLLYCEEFRLSEPVSGTSEFAKEFEKKGPFDSKGRSLRQLDLKTRMFKYPCSYLIYSDAFRALPEPVLTRVMSELEWILTADDPVPGYEHLTQEDRTAIHEIIKETLPDLTLVW